MRVLPAFLALFAAPAFAQTALYAEAFGPTGAYALGVEQGVVASAAGDRRLAVRAGVSYRNETTTFVGSSTEHVLAVPFGAVASFSLGRPLGVPLAADVGGGAVFTRRTGERYDQTTGEAFGLPVYGEAVLRAALGRRLSVRAGAVVGGVSSEFVSGEVRPVVGVGFGL